MLYNDVVNFDKGRTASIGSMISDTVYRGEVGRVLLGEAVDKNDLLYPVITSLGTIAEWKQANADSASTMPALAIALEDGADEQRIKVMFKGFIKDIDFNYGTQATGTIVQTAIIAEGDRIVLGDKLNPYCFQFTALKGTTAAAKLSAVSTLTTSGIGVNAQTFSIDGVVFECSTDGAIETTSDYMVDLQVSTAQGALETAIEDAIDQAIADKALRMTRDDFTSNVLTLTLDDSYVGLEQNDVPSLTGTMANAAFTATTFLGGVPAVDYWVANVAVEATQKTLFMAALDQAIEDGLDITYADFTGGGANDNLVMTAGTDSHKGYKGNNLQMYECGSTGVKDDADNVSVGAAAFAGGVEGGELYASTSKGLLTLTKPTNCMVQSVGYAVEADKFFFNPMPPVNEVAESSEHGTGAIGTGLAPKTYRKTLDNGDIVTEIHVDLTGLKVKGDAAADAIGLGTGGAAYIGQYVVATYGIVYRIEMICLEVPHAGSGTITVDINLEAEAAADIAYDGACSDEILMNTGGLAAGKMFVNNVPAMVADRYLYLTEGDTAATAGVFDTGQVVIRFYGHPVLS